MTTAELPRREEGRESGREGGPEGTAAAIGDQLPRRRRRLGLSLMGLGVLALALQGFSEWLLPYDVAALEAVRRLTDWPRLSAARLVWIWALLCGALLALLARRRRPPLALAPLTGLVLGSAHVAAGGAAASLALLLLVGVASLGWHARREGGMALLLGCALAMASWDAVLSSYATLWGSAAVLSAMFVWIDRMHIRANDRRLYSALAERDRLITRLDQRTEELTALQGARTRLLASISHDLRQPLQAVRLFAEALQAPGDGNALQAPGGADARRQDLLRQQMRAADDAVAMLDQFSEFSAIEQGALQSHPEVVDLRDLLDGVAASLQATHPPELLRLRVHGRHHGLYTDRTQLARLVQNLAGNAVRYSLGAQPGRPARVVLAVRPRRAADGAEELLIDVHDNGRGIPHDKLEAVFEPYVQLSGAGSGASRGGRGLGLAIVRGLAAQLGLQLAPVVSRLGRGTRFRVVVPAALRRAPQEAAVAPVAPVVQADRLDGWLLALLEDEDAPRVALRAALEGVGATIVAAATLDQLKSQLDAEPRFPDALVFDLDLGPGRPDGLAAVAELRDEWELLVPAVIVTGRIAVMGTVPMPKRCTLLGKPVPLAVLVGTLRRIAPPARAAA
ncbi:putative Histidine kinase [Rubrivivax sp. A210]|uniref:ATP-binding protein n=1 Tax=Rubrivivax sp. A210 TaxID=2772301 RepID=UPI001918FF5D|nr:ATP-binding protein [Rubrivivax sp. A210]CAD5373264.1 putative Histidine kinase [Rubrivivax sp. A210]